ncbi:hypothetical protein AD951_02660 [Acetobacter malorum]|uniref:Uncharacterized protein n=1 Tax=Acetobacter malorum TaxID=178901 RepID=A0A149URI4_9PROT|nr:hypothetical protein [Acetobacter malorum]KXV70527.1 hypothetical protein AD951_02660 [Acetobacter malorum]
MKEDFPEGLNSKIKDWFLQKKTYPSGESFARWEIGLCMVLGVTGLAIVIGIGFLGLYFFTHVSDVWGLVILSGMVVVTAVMSGAYRYVRWALEKGGG